MLEKISQFKNIIGFGKSLWNNYVKHNNNNNNNN